MEGSRESYCSEEEYCVRVKKSLSDVKKNSCNVATALREKYKKVLGTKEPIVVLQQCSLLKNILGNQSSQRISKNNVKVNINKKNKKKNNKTSKKIANKTKNLNNNDLLLYNTKIVLPKLSKKEVENVKIVTRNHSRINCNTIVATPNCSDRLKEGIHNFISPGENSSVSILDKSDFEFDTWKKKHKTVKKANTLRNSKRLNTFLEEKNCNQKLTTVNVETLQRNILKRKWEATKYNSDKKRKYNTYSAQSTDSNTTLHITVGSTRKTCPMDDQLIHKRTNDWILNTSYQTVKNVLYKTDDNQNSFMKKQIKNCIILLNNIPCENIRNVKTLPIVSEEIILPDNTIKTDMKQIIPKEDCTKSTIFHNSKVTKEEINFQNFNFSTEEKYNIDRINNITYDRTQHSQENKNLLKQSGIKVNRNTCFQNSKSKSSTVETCNDTSNVIETNTDKTMPLPRVTSISELNILAQNENNENGISNSAEQSQIKTYKNVNEQEDDSLQKTWKLTKIISETYMSPIQNKHLLSDEANLNDKSTIGDEDEDSDCISLFADSALIKEYDSSSTTLQYDSSYNSLYAEEAYVMTDNVIDNYYEKTTHEFNALYDVSSKNNCTQDTAQCILKNESSSSMKLVQDSQTNKITKRTRNKQYDNKFKTICQGYCYKIIKFGKCSKYKCHFNHDVMPFMLNLHKQDEQYLFNVIDTLASENSWTFLCQFYETLVIDDSNVILILKICRKLYKLNIVTKKMGINTIKKLVKERVTIKTIVNHLMTIINDNDFEFVNWILNILKDYTCIGDYWNLVKPLLLRIKHVNPFIINVILEECIITQKYIQEVHENVICKLNDHTRSGINKKLLSSFNDLFKSTKEHQDVEKATFQQPIRNILSPESDNNVNESIDQSVFTRNETFEIITSKVWINISDKTNKWDNNNNTQNEKSFFTLYPIDDLPKPYSKYGREIFWNFYVQVHSLQEGLKHKDYNHVKEILNSVREEKETFFTRACYQILCNEIKYSQYHLE